jgi:hypothetical protein
LGYFLDFKTIFENSKIKILKRQTLFEIQKKSFEQLFIFSIFDLKKLFGVFLEIWMQIYKFYKLVLLI